MKQVDPAQVDGKWQVQQRHRAICLSANNDFPNIGRIAERFMTCRVPEESELQVGRQGRQMLYQRGNHFADPTGSRTEVAAIECDVGTPIGRANLHCYKDFIRFGLAEFWRVLPHLRTAWVEMSHALAKPQGKGSVGAGIWQISGIFVAQMTFISDHFSASNLSFFDRIYTWKGDATKIR